MNIDLTDKNIMNKMGAPFWPYAWLFRIKITQSDVDYIVNTIKKDKHFYLFYTAFKRENNYKLNLSLLDRAYMNINMIVFLDKFYNDSNCPEGTKSILFAFLGIHRDFVNEEFPGLLSERYFIVEQWFKTVR